MTLTEEKRTELLEAAKPLIKWLNENTHPHCEASVTQDYVELLEGVALCRTDLYLRD